MQRDQVAHVFLLKKKYVRVLLSFHKYFIIYTIPNLFLLKEEGGTVNQRFILVSWFYLFSDLLEVNQCKKQKKNTFKNCNYIHGFVFVGFQN